MSTSECIVKDIRLCTAALLDGLITRPSWRPIMTASGALSQSFLLLNFYFVIHLHKKGVQLYFWCFTIQQNMFEVNIPKAKSFLYFFSLRNGVKILGWMFLVGHFMSIFETPMRNLHKYRECSLIPLYEDEDTGSHVCPDWLLLELLITLVADWTLIIVQIITAFLLLLGVYQTKPRLIFQWIILQISMLIIDVILTKLSYLREDVKYNTGYFYLYYETWIIMEIYGIYICYCYYISVISDPTQDV